MLRQGRPQPQGGADAGATGYELQIRDKLLTDRTGGSFLTGSIVNVQNAPEGTRIVPGQWNTFDVSSDGQRFLIPRAEAANINGALANTPITVVLNWTAALRKK